MTDSEISILRNLRKTRTLVLHPDDEDGIALTRHLVRVGCAAERVWPAPAELPQEVSVVLFLLSPDEDSNSYEWMSSEADVARIAIISYETPEILVQLDKLNAHSILTKPIRHFGVLAAVTNSIQVSNHIARLRRRIRLQDETLKGRRKVETAIGILRKSRGISEEKAYRLLREKSMRDRIPISELAEAFIVSSDL
ncbi:ANTAR domain-containing response regulator [Sneathiella litorea]|uniref:ANTAR domain-containing protein n=1 Tax=Sneathiella litorea TaxID=2606216 RepID=A0A6L8W393_9PROT|nr:ANTAR domain-containing protein [Sneathiella litorea]MZR29546.1 ANTAR domain-containing protein [Sneathiella litorea]